MVGATCQMEDPLSVRQCTRALMGMELHEGDQVLGATAI